MKDNRGFTLIELAIVMAIVAVLVAVALPKYTDLLGQAGDAAVYSSASSVLSAYAMATAQAGGVPTCAQVFARLGLTGSGSPPEATVSVGGRYTTTIRCDPAGDVFVIWNSHAATYRSSVTGFTLNLEVD